MKKLFILFVLGLSVPAAAEVVSTVSFNPSRMGSYQNLKISRDANFKGGLKATTLNVNTGGTVQMRWDGANTTEKYYYVPNITGGTGTAVDMPATTFLTQDPLTLATVNYNAGSASPSTGVGPSITMHGGTLDFATNNDSYVATVNAASMELYTKNLNEDTLSISGADGATRGLTPDGVIYTAHANGDTKGTGAVHSRGFHLAGVDIPHPTGSYVAQTGGTALADNAGLCWVPRCTSAGKVVWVLSLVNGVNKASPDSACPKPASVSCSGSSSEVQPGGLSWQNEGWEEVGEFGCGSDSVARATAACAAYSNTAYTGSCTTAGEKRYANCTANDYCPGKGVTAEAFVYVCR